MTGASSAMIPLCVDLDGTVIRTDMLLETLILLLKRKPWCVVFVPFWLLRGKAILKRRLAERVWFDPAVLPYRTQFLDFLRAERAAGRKLVLATASDRLVAEKIGHHLALFDEVIASEPGSNRKGIAKLAVLQQRFPQGFDYAGNSAADLPLWKCARRSVIVDAVPRLLRVASGGSHLERVFSTPEKPLWSRLGSALRFHQWAKNLLIFVPVITSHRVLDPPSMAAAGLAFAAFCLCASSVYIVNDMLDLEADRRHDSKHRRPFAAGTLPLTAGFALIPCLLTGSGIVASFLPRATVAVLVLYFALTFAYSLYLKRKLLLDVFALSALYTIRIVAGHTATGISLSAWLLSFSIFFFLSMAFIKRVSELRKLRSAGGQTPHGRGYEPTDLEQLNLFGVASGFLSVLVFASYINSDAVVLLYRHPPVLWLMCPLLLYWISRIWIVSSRGNLNEDPILFAVKDRVTYYVAIICALLLIVASRDWSVLERLGIR